MGEEICEVCGYRSQLGGVEKRPIFPREIIEQAGITRWQVISICSNCQAELNKWYALKVAAMAYDAGMQRFSYKTSGQMVEEYQAAFDSFTGYKKRRSQENRPG
ncbi:MAG: hypothetical protein A2Z29_06345 [Chloroflexi bacterium RBG_16_56_11]|nr:MAG: hypothetical protein A2Z29_06345 [Chloroflexi bacterium RBG_16_56_11]